MRFEGNIGLKGKPDAVYKGADSRLNEVGISKHGTTKWHITWSCLTNTCFSLLHLANDEAQPTRLPYLSLFRFKVYQFVIAAHVTYFVWID